MEQDSREVVDLAMEITHGDNGSFTWEPSEIHLRTDLVAATGGRDLLRGECLEGFVVSVQSRLSRLKQLMVLWHKVLQEGEGGRDVP